MTVQTLTPEPRRSFAHFETQHGFTQTEAKPCSRASRQSLARSAGRASAFSSVWSMYFASFISDQGKEFLADLLVRAEAAEHRRRGHLGVLLLDAADHHAGF